jgi:hypothetical protein
MSIEFHLKLSAVQWLTTVILATQEAEIRRIVLQRHPGGIFTRPYLERTHHKSRQVEWLKQ